MEFGVFVPQGWRMDLTAIDDPVEQFEAMTGVAKAADAGPWDSIWVYDHFHTVPDPTMNTTFESWTISATMARDTERIHIGQMVNCNGYRHPSLFAKIASTVDVASHGRLYAGYGAGWYEHEWLAYGFGFPETKERMAMFREGTEILHKMWTEDYPKFEGKHYRIDGPINEPKSHKPGHKIPLWIGGGGPQVTLKLVAKFGDATNLGFDVLGEKLEILERHCDAVGRDFDEITKSTTIHVYPIPTGADPVQATAAVRKQYDDMDYATFADRAQVLEPAAILEKVETVRANGGDYLINYIPGLAYDLEPLHIYENEVIARIN